VSRELPPLVSIRGWDANDDPRYPVFLDQIRATGIKVIDIYVGAENHKTMQSIVDAATADIEDQLEQSGIAPDEPFDMLAYCVGGDVLLGAAHTFQQRRRPTPFLGLIDCYITSPKARVTTGVYGRYGISWSHRLRDQADRLAEPSNEKLTAVIGSWIGQYAKSFRIALRHGPRWTRRKNSYGYAYNHLSFEGDLPYVTKPVVLYNTSQMITEAEGDRSLGLSRYLRSGYVVRVLAEQDHHNCITPPHSDALIALIAADRSEPPGTTRQT